MREVETLVIGGGPAGLIGGLYLARFKRGVLVVDDACSRASRIPRSHNWPGHPDGIPGAQLVADMRAHAERYGVPFAAGRAHTLRRDGDGFIAEWADGAARARLVLLATGALDVPPPLPHLAEALRDGSLRYCPVCDGFEVIGQDVGVLVDSADDFRKVQYLRHFTDRVTVFPISEQVRFDDSQRRQFAEAGITLVDEPVTSLRHWNGRVTVHHGDRFSACDVVYAELGLRVHSELAQALGARCDEHGAVCIDEHHRTSVPGLFAAGDVSVGLDQISVAAGGAAIATSAMHRALLWG